jgi:predicted HTH transcriptional regulator
MTEKELKYILEQGEGYRIEFKEQIAGLDKEMVAFANASGGFIYLGINDKNQVAGIEADNRLLSQVQDIAQNCDPPVKIIPRKYKNIFIVEVREGSDKPYRCSAGFYNRVGPNSQKMRRNEIVEFVKSEGKIRFDEMVNRDFQKKDFDEEKFVRAIFYRYPTTEQVAEQATEQVTEQAAEQVTPQAAPRAVLSVDNEKIQKILSFCLEPRSREEIQDFLGLKHREYFRSEILQPLLKEGLLVPTIPGKPNSPKQKYVTAKGAENQNFFNGRTP